MAEEICFTRVNRFISVSFFLLFGRVGGWGEAVFLFFFLNDVM